MLEVKDLQAWYGPGHALQGVSLEVRPREIVALIGRNGAGKTTTLKTIMGLIARCQGSVLFEERELLGLPTHRRFALGLAYVPEQRRIVPGLSVRDNLRLGMLADTRGGHEAARIDRIAEVFPRLKERLAQEAVTLSGGEQQMLAIARAIVSQPKLVMLDEPSEGIMPVLVDEIFELFKKMRRDGQAILLVEQNVELALEVADRAYIIDQGRIVHHAAAAELLADEAIKERYCAV
jgi:branched-chain amino acid transport system ATP-binding protein